MRRRSGREKVEALIAQIERGGGRMNPPLDLSVTRMLRERLGSAADGRGFLHVKILTCKYNYM